MSEVPLYRCLTRSVSSQVVMPGSRYNPKICGAEKRPGSPKSASPNSPRQS